MTKTRACLTNFALQETKLLLNGQVRCVESMVAGLGGLRILGVGQIGGEDINILFQEDS